MILVLVLPLTSFVSLSLFLLFLGPLPSVFLRLKGFKHEDL